MCNCELSTVHIQNDAFGCGQHDQLITYRGRILGGFDYSALGLVELMQTWIDSRRATMVINSFRMQVDPSCPARLDSINAEDCPLGDSLPPGVIIPTTETTKPVNPLKATDPVVIIQNSDSKIRAGEIGGIAIGSLILILLTVLVLLIVGIALCKGRFHRKIVSSRSVTVQYSHCWFYNFYRSGSKKFENEYEDSSPFKDMEPRYIHIQD